MHGWILDIDRTANIPNSGIEESGLVKGEPS
jgi:hypothetical protein